MSGVNDPRLGSVWGLVSTENMNRLALFAESGSDIRNTTMSGDRIRIAGTVFRRARYFLSTESKPNPMQLGPLKCFADWLGSSFLGERRWSVVVPIEKGELRELVSSRIVPLRKRRLFAPLVDSRQVAKVRGFVEGEVVLLLPPRLGVLGNLFGLNTLFRFAGRLTEGPTGAEISGRYQVVPFARGLMFVWLTGVMVCIALSFGLIVWCLLVKDHDRALVSLLMAAVGFGLLGTVYLLGKIIDWATKPSRFALHAFLIELSAAKPAVNSDDPRA